MNRGAYEDRPIPRVAWFRELRKILGAGLILALLLAAIPATVWIVPRIFSPQFFEDHLGKTRAEVLKDLGEPAVDFSTRDTGRPPGEYCVIYSIPPGFDRLYLGFERDVVTYQSVSAAH